MNRLDEFTRNQILKDVQRKVVNRAKSLEAPEYIGVTKDYVVQMRVKSATGSGSYIVKIKLVEYPDIATETDITTREKVRLALAGDIAIHCSCPAFKWWGYEYIMTQLGANSSSVQDIYPQVRNPKLEGTLCKHSYKAIKRFGSYWSRVAKDIDMKHFVREVS